MYPIRNKPIVPERVRQAQSIGERTALAIVRPKAPKKKVRDTRLLTLCEAMGRGKPNPLTDKRLYVDPSMIYHTVEHCLLSMLLGSRVKPIMPPRPAAPNDPLRFVYTSGGAQVTTALAPGAVAIIAFCYDCIDNNTYTGNSGYAGGTNLPWTGPIKVWKLLPSDTSNIVSLNTSSGMQHIIPTTDGYGLMGDMLDWTAPNLTPPFASDQWAQSGWIGGVDPRTLVAGDPQYQMLPDTESTVTYQPAYTNTAAYQFLGATQSVEVDVPYQGQCVVGGLGQNESPRVYSTEGRLMMPQAFDRAVTSQIHNRIGKPYVGDVGPITFVSQSLLATPVSEILNLMNYQVLVGASRTSSHVLTQTASCLGRGFQPYTTVGNIGTSSAVQADAEWTNWSQGCLPIFNPLACIGQGYGFMVVNNTGTGNVTITAKTTCSYAVSVAPTNVLYNSSQAATGRVGLKVPPNATSHHLPGQLTIGRRIQDAYNTRAPGDPSYVHQKQIISSPSFQAQARIELGPTWHRVPIDINPNEAAVHSGPRSTGDAPLQPKPIRSVVKESDFGGVLGKLKDVTQFFTSTVPSAMKFANRAFGVFDKIPVLGKVSQALEDVVDNPVVDDIGDAIADLF